MGKPLDLGVVGPSGLGGAALCGALNDGTWPPGRRARWWRRGCPWPGAGCLKSWEKPPAAGDEEGGAVAGDWETGLPSPACGGPQRTMPGEAGVAVAVGDRVAVAFVWRRVRLLRRRRVAAVGGSPAGLQTCTSRRAGGVGRGEQCQD
jgi:hypothetical protein